MGVRQPRIEADFSGGAITSNAGILLAGLAAQGMNLFDRLGACFRDHRRPDLTVHSCRSLAGQRVLGILLGHEDLSDHEELRKDPALGSVLGRLESRRADCAPLAGKSTLNRFELSAAGVNPWKARKIAAGFGKMDRLIGRSLHREACAAAGGDRDRPRRHRLRAARRPGAAILSRVLR